jgi:hypothetical protein
LRLIEAVLQYTSWPIGLDGSEPHRLRTDVPKQAWQRIQTLVQQKQQESQADEHGSPLQQGVRIRKNGTHHFQEIALLPNAPRTLPFRALSRHLSVDQLIALAQKLLRPGEPTDYTMLWITSGNLRRKDLKRNLFNPTDLLLSRELPEGRYNRYHVAIPLVYRDGHWAILTSSTHGAPKYIAQFLSAFDWAWKLRKVDR